jgi:[ribosomal protein S18]-alanine N-acetyltransferase
MVRPLELKFRPMDLPHAQAVVEWHYPSPYDVYDLSTEHAAALSDEAAQYFAAFRDGELVGFCCFGAEARVPGLEPEPDVLDVGAGLRPDLVGRGIGARFLARVVDFAAEREPRAHLRVCIAAFNVRAQRAAAAVGFSPVGTHRTGDRTFAVLQRRPVAASAVPDGSPSS